jgi:hypothetical protein
LILVFHAIVIANYQILLIISAYRVFFTTAIESNWSMSIEIEFT